MVDIITAMSILSSMSLKIYEAMSKGTPVNLTEEVDRLIAAKMKTSESLIAEADAAMGKTPV
jgi:hypothetical protein